MSVNTLTRGARRYSVGSTAVDSGGPTSIAGLRHYFDYATLANGPVPAWVDGVSGVTMAQPTPAAQPVKSSVGLRFNGTGGFQTTTPFSFPTTFSLYLDTAAYGALVVNGTSFGFFIQSRLLLRYFGSGVNLTNLLPLRMFHDVLYVSSSTSTGSLYINGGYVGDFATGPGGASTFTYIGTDPGSENFTGLLNHVAFWPSALTAADAVTLHQFRLNTCNGTA
jgi:hypothetical protein